MIRIIVYLLIFLSNIYVKSYAKCVSLPNATLEDQLINVCNEAVNYEFYLSNTTTLSTLNEIARFNLNNSFLSILPTECLISLKKLVCSNIYLKCYPSGENYNIYSDINLDIPLPFERPCKSICEDVNTKCLGLLNLFGMEQNCSSKYDYSFGMNISNGLFPYQYDQSNNINYCNNMESNFKVGSTYEPYIYAKTNGACAGITTELYIPPSNEINPLFSPLLPPYTIQSIIEENLLQSFQSLPKWLGESCHFALRKYFCGSYMLKPQNISFTSILSTFNIDIQYSLLTESEYAGVNISALQNLPIFLPSYPSKHICEDYSNICSIFIELSGDSSLIPDCNERNNNINSFPNMSQIITYLPLGGIDIPLSTNPNYMMNTNDNEYIPLCPDGFVVPDDPKDIGVTFVPGDYSGCAISCKVPILTISEYETFSKLSDYGPNFALPLEILVLLIWFIDKSKSKQHLIILFNIIALIVTIQCVYMSAYSFETKFCRNNAVSISHRDGLNGCNVQSFFLMYFILAEAITWCLICFDIFLKVNIKYRIINDKFKRLFQYYVMIIFTLPLISIGLLGGQKIYGYYGFNTFCLSNPYTNNWDLIIFILPILALTIIGSIFMILVIIKIYKTSNQSNRYVAAHSIAVFKIPWKLIRMPFVFVILYAGVWLTLIIFRFQVYFKQNDYNNSFIHWVECVFIHYNGSIDSYESICGSHPKIRPNLILTYWSGFITNSHALIVSSLFLLNPAIWSFVYQCFRNDKETSMNTDRRSIDFQRLALNKELSKSFDSINYHFGLSLSKDSFYNDSTNNIDDESNHCEHYHIDPKLYAEVLRKLNLSYDSSSPSIKRLNCDNLDSISYSIKQDHFMLHDMKNDDCISSDKYSNKYESPIQTNGIIKDFNTDGYNNYHNNNDKIDCMNDNNGDSYNTISHHDRSIEYNCDDNTNIELNRMRNLNQEHNPELYQSNILNSDYEYNRNSPIKYNSTKKDFILSSHQNNHNKYESNIKDSIINSNHQDDYNESNIIKSNQYNDDFNESNINDCSKIKYNQIDFNEFNMINSIEYNHNNSNRNIESNVIYANQKIDNQKFEESNIGIQYNNNKINEDNKIILKEIELL